MIKLYIIGISILIIAIIANAIIAKLDLLSWYDFLETIELDGWDAFKKVELIDYFWLFIGYPLVLGLGYMIGDKIYGLF